MLQEPEIEEQATECGLPRTVLCMETTPNSLWVGTTAGLYLYRDLRAPAASFLSSETINALAVASATVYVAVKRNWGLYQVSPTLRITPIEPPEVTTAEYMEPRALAVWNNALAIASTTGLHRYALSRREWELADREVYRYLLATGMRLWACGSQLVGFDRQYRPVERVPVRIATPPVLEQSRLWWATASGGIASLHSYSLGIGKTQREDFPLNDAAMRVGGWSHATALARFGAFWYVGLGGRGRGMVVRLNLSSKRAELAWQGASVNTLAVWRGSLMVGARDGLYALRRAE
ncbi:MAG: hypothetical protein N2651_00095 [Fimbriimonadales bacterium]|nr:hypothetical protein [Fimbriimonadales bacterium]